MASYAFHSLNVTRTVDGERVTVPLYNLRARILGEETGARALALRHGLRQIRLLTWVRHGMTGEEAEELEAVLRGAGWEEQGNVV